MQLLKKKAIYIFWAALSAVGYLYLTNYVFAVVAQGHVLTATILNLALIICFLIIDKISDFVYIKANLKEKKKKSIVFKLLSTYLTGVSIKSTLYFFFIGTTVCSAILAADPEFIPALYHMRDLFKSVEYGILLLIAADQFLGQIFKDITSNAHRDIETNKQ